jgi:hypothetical protein
MSSENQNPRPEVDRRSGCRLRISGAATIECRKGGLGLGPNIAQSAITISETGVCLLLRVTLETGTETEVLVSGPGLTRPLRRLAQVVSVQPLGDGTCRAGLRFDRPLPYIDMVKVTKPR